MRIDRDAFDNARPAPVAELEVLAPFVSIHGGRRVPEPEAVPVPLREIRVTGTLAGMLARLSIEHRFELPGTSDGDPIDARYRFPVPPGAAVQAVTMHFGDEVIEAVLRERREAEDRFEHAKATGRPAVLVTDSGRGVLTLEAAGITPGIALAVTTEIVALPRLEADGRCTLRIPLTTGSRYVRGDEDETAREVNPVAIAASVPYTVTLELRVAPDLRVGSPTHTLVEDTSSDGRVVRLDGPVAADRDLVIETRPSAAATLRGSVLLGETRDGRTPWLATVVAPDASPGATPRLPRSLVLLVDRSGSMNGAKWATASWAVRSLVAGMADDDSFLVLAFDTTIERSGPGLTPMDRPARSAVSAWIGAIAPRGGTELGPALQEALATRPRKGTQAEVLVITDGQVSDAARILSLVGGSPWRVSVLCIDSAPNTFLASTLAERGGGDSWFLTSRPDGEDITDAVDRITASFGAPAVGDLVLHAPAGGAIGRAQAADGRLSVAVGAMPAGSVRLVAGWTDGEPAGFEVSGTAVAELPVAPGREPAVNALVAAARIRILEQAERLAYGGQGDVSLVLREASRAGLDPASLPGSGPVYAPIPGSTQGDSLTEALGAEVVRCSLDGRVLSSRTAFVGVRSQPGKRSIAQVDVPSALPEGWDEPGQMMLASASLASMSTPMPGSPMLRRMAAPGRGSRPRGMASHPLTAAAAEPSAMLMRIDASLAWDPGTVAPMPDRPVVELRLAVADLLRGVTQAAPVGTWTLVRLSGTVGDATGAYLVIWTTDRTRPLFRARLADLLAVGERPAGLAFGAGEEMSIVIEGGSLATGELVVTLVA